MPVTRPRPFVPLRAAWLLLWLAGPLALARAGDPPRPRWPVDNPGFAREGFRPSSKERLLSGVFGPRLKWGEGRYDHHEGFDFHAFFDPAHPDGHVPVRAILPGVVSEVIDPPDPEKVETGRKVVVTHDATWADFGAPAAWGPLKSGYLHLTSIAVKPGQRLEPGALIGVAGESGHTTVVHLHLNLYRAGPGRAGSGGRDVNVNPARVFSPALFPGTVAGLDPKTLEVSWLERDAAAGTALVRVLLPWNVCTLDGVALAIDDDQRRALSFERVTAEQHARRDSGHEDLFPDLRLFPLRWNGGGALDKVNAEQPPGWPAARVPPPPGQGPRQGFDLLATQVPPRARRFVLTLTGVAGERVTVEGRRFESAR